MSHRLPQASRETVLGPPKGWRPRALTIAEKLQVVVNQQGFEPFRQMKLQPLELGVQFDHVPAIQERRWDPEKEDTIPPSCDLRYIEAVNKPTHAKKTHKRDLKEIRKTRRLEKRRQAK